MFKKKYLLLTLFLIIIFQILLYTNNNQKTSFRYFKWTLQEVSIGKLISISFFSGLFVSTLLNTKSSSTFSKVFFLKLVLAIELFNRVLIKKPEKNEMLISLPILTSWWVHLKYLNEVF